MGVLPGAAIGGAAGALGLGVGAVPGAANGAAVGAFVGGVYDGAKHLLGLDSAPSGPPPDDAAKIQKESYIGPPPQEQKTTVLKAALNIDWCRPHLIGAGLKFAMFRIMARLYDTTRIRKCPGLSAGATVIWLFSRLTTTNAFILGPRDTATKNGNLRYRPIRAAQS
jgi:hypothetical protein